MDFYELARAVVWASKHPKYKQPELPKVGDWVRWVEWDDEGKPIRMCWTQLE